MILSVSDLSICLGKSQIINGLFFNIPEGETVGIIGPNGSGKTTFFNAISGFVPQEKGEINFKYKNINKLQPFERAQLGIGRVFQHSGVFHEMTLKENILVACEARGKKITDKEIISALETVNLAERLNDLASSLSGGQKRLLEMCRAVTAGAELFLLDEPTAGVSPKMKAELVSFIKKLQEQNKTILVIEHDMNFISEFSRRIVVLDQGQIVLDGTPQEVRENPQLREIYFGK